MICNFLEEIARVQVLSFCAEMNILFLLLLNLCFGLFLLVDRELDLCEAVSKRH